MSQCVQCMQPVSRSVVSNVVHGDVFCCVCSVLNGLEWSGVDFLNLLNVSNSCGEFRSWRGSSDCLCQHDNKQVKE